jgi:hypothetical protein
VTLDAALRGLVPWIDVKEGKLPVLVRVLGRRRTRTRIVPVTAASLQAGGCYVLDCGPMIYQWCGFVLFLFCYFLGIVCWFVCFLLARYGSKSNRFQQAKALDIASRTRMKEKGGGAKV